MSDDGAVAAAKPARFLPSARRLARRLAPERAKVAATVALGASSVVLGVLGPTVLGRATDLIVAGVSSGGIDDTTLSRLLLQAAALYVGVSATSYLQGLVLNGVIQRTVLALRKDLELQINRLPVPYFDTQSRGDLLSRVTNDVDNISETLQQTLSQVVTSALTIIGVLIAMFALSPVLAVIALLAVPLTTVVTTLVARRSQPLFAAQWADTGALNGQVEEAYTGHVLLKVFNRQAAAEQRFAATNDDLFTTSFGAQFVSGVIQPASAFIGNLGYVAIAVVGAVLVIGGSLTIGGVQAFIQYSRQLTQPLSQLGSMANLLQSGVASAERVFAILDAQDQSPDPPQPATPTSRAGRLAFLDVSFRYDPATPLIDALSFTAEPGRTVAVVGATGAGKSTLVNLALRFYELDAGRIELDGTDLAAMTRADLRARFGTVMQDTWLFAGTIRENIRFGRLSASDDEVLAAARTTFVDPFVRTLPDGYDTVLDDGATSISIGQKQLITIARAFLSQPSVLVLDEATSSVDTRTEVALQQAMDTLRAGRTSLVIAHRLSTIRDADVILVMAAGAIVERGSHQQLIRQQGEYARLYQAQFADGT